MQFPKSAKSTKLDAEYDPAYVVYDTEKHLRWYVEESAAVRRALSWSLDVPYGVGRNETLDIVQAHQPAAAVVVFLHGGYWQSFRSKEFNFVARGLHARGMTVMVPNHSHCPSVTIADITQQSRRAIAWIHRNASSFYGDPDRIFIVGHSAGGHQVAMLSSTSWYEEYGMPLDTIKGAITISGIFDLRPLRDCSLQENLGLTDEIVHGQSPIFHVPDMGPPLLVSFGGDETSEFHRQSTDYLARWREKGLSGSLFIQQGRNHFDAIEGLGDAESELCKRIVEFIERAENRDKTTGVRRKSTLGVAKLQTQRPAPMTLQIANLSPIADVANRAEVKSGPKAATVAPFGLPIKRADRTKNLALSFAQQRLWFIERLFPGTVDYNEPILIRMDSAVDAGTLEKALAEIVRRHEAWRTVFPVVDGTPMQRILPAGPFQLDVVDGATWSLETRDAEVQRVAVQHARMPFSLEQGPLVRALLIRLSETEARLVVTAHHIIVDGVSFFHVFLPELSAIYAAFSIGEPSPLPEPTLHYADFADWQFKCLDEAALAPRLAYWKSHLAGFSDLALPIDFPRPQVPTGQGARVPIAVSADMVAQLRAIGKAAGVTLFTTLLAVWKMLLFRYADQGDVIVGSAAAGRPCREFEGLIGFFNNNLVLRTQLDGTMSFVDLLHKVGETLAKAREHQDVPFDRLVAAVDARRGPHESPLYNNTFILMPPVAPLGPTPDWSAGRIDIGVAKVDLYLELHQRPSGLLGHIEYRTELFAQETIERMVGHFGILLEAIVRNPAMHLADFPLLTAAESQQLAVWQGPRKKAAADDPFVSLEGLFEAQVERSPSAIAIEYNDVRLTYAELDTRANRLAHYLRSVGVRPETLVGLCIDRSIDALVAILAVLKAGGAYVPLDPTYPTERLRFILEDASIALLLTNRKNGNVLPQYRGRTIFLDDDHALITAQEASRPVPLAGAEHLAYIIYTSGSTGRPKGVMVERRGLYYLAKAQERAFGLGVGSRVLQFFSINFDGSVWDFTLAWPVGATLVLADQEAMLPGSALAHFLKKTEINVVMVTPSALAVTPYCALPALHTLIATGEALPAELVDRWAPGRRFFNLGAPTETTVVSIATECQAGAGKPPFGRPYDHVAAYVLDPNMQPVPMGVPGELYIGGPGVTRGYLGRPDLTADRFIDSPFPETAGTRIYKTGDRVKWRPDGQIDYLGRMDRQVKLRGFRIELGEIEVEIGHHPAIEMAAVQIIEVAGDKRIAAYIVPRSHAPADIEGQLKNHLRERLPEFMVPATCVKLDALPLNPSGKIDRAALRAPVLPRPEVIPNTTSLDQSVAAIWKEILGLTEVGIDTPFFDVGGHSLALARVQAKIQSQFGVDIDMMTLLRLPTIRKIAAHVLSALPRPTIQPTPEPSVAPTPTAKPAPHRADAIAIVGMAIRAPYVSNPNDLWNVVRSGSETIRAFDPEALIAAGAEATRVRQPNFIPSEGVLEDADHFDAAFFGFSDADATWLDPQQRQFLECAYEALEHAGYDARRYQNPIGVFAGATMPRYWLGPVSEALGSGATDSERYRAQTLNAPDFLATRVAFKLGLRGPAVAVQTACSTSLSAVHMARQNLLAGDCDIALAGGVSLSSLGVRDWGYLHVEEGIASADGHCRPFDADASGMVKSSGVAVVVLKRLADAIADSDTIHAVILGSAMNNDGSDKLGFTAPSEDGVAAVIERACKVARVDPASIEFVEAHGTGTRLGDPTEVRALTRAYRKWTDKQGYCALGAIKANIGHLDAAAGAAGLIKATLALSHETIPPVPGYRQPNPLLELPSTPFFVNDTARPWPRTNDPRRAGVSALGIGGTNVHVVLEEAPPTEHSSESRPFQIICISARTKEALSKVSQRLRSHLGTNPDTHIGDVAYTLAVGRAPQRFRTTVVCRNVMGAIGALMSEPPPATPFPISTSTRPVVFLFPGHGAQYVQMALDTYRAEPIFRAEIDRCFDLVHTDAGLDLRPLLFGAKETEHLLDEMIWAQPFLFAIEYALAKQLIAWGVRPSVMLGHSLGEYVAACIANVFSLRDALALVVARGRLMDRTPAGRMLTVFADPQTVQPFLVDGVAIATYAPNCVVLSGSASAIDVVRTRLANTEIETNDVRVSRASHSAMMHGIRHEFRKHVASVRLNAPTIPVVSNVTGKYMTADQATSADAWADHLCSPVRLSDGFGALLDLETPVFLEMGPENTLGSLLKAHSRFAAGSCEIVGTLPSLRKRAEPSHASLLHGLGRLWEIGLDIDWHAFYAAEKRRRIPLPTYPFERRRYSLVPSTADVPAPFDARASTISREIGAVSVDEIPRLAERMEELCAHLVLDFFARRLTYTLGQTRTMEKLRADTGILPKFNPMFEFLVDLLERSGMATRMGANAISIHTEGVGRSAELAVSLRRDEPLFLGWVLYLEYCVTQYDEALTGETEPIGVLYPDGTDAFYQECMRENAASFHQVYMALARDVVLDIVNQNRGKKIRILEVGAGHGRLTWPLVERLKGKNVEYHFTDVGRSFLHIADRKAAKRGISWMKTLRFDLNRSPAEQGFHERYDLILGLDSVHVATDLTAALTNLRELLEPGGSLICVEGTRFNTWSQLVWGLAPGFWDVVHSRGSLAMSLPDWHRDLKQSGFSAIEVVPKNQNRQRVEDCGLFIAEHAIRVADTPAETWHDLAIPVAPNGQITIANRDEPSAITRSPMSTDSTDSASSIAQHLWRRMLGVSTVSPAANFFELGGDSLLAVHFLAEFNLRTGRKVKMAQFMADPCVRGVVALEGSPAPTPLRVFPPSGQDDAPESDAPPPSLGRARRPPMREAIDELPQPQPTLDDRPTMSADEMEIRSFLQRFTDRMSARDGAAVGAMFTPDDRCVSVGVGESILEGSETIKEYYKRKMASLVELRAHIRQPKIVVLAGGRAATIMALFDSDQTYVEGRRRVTYSDTRLSLALEKQDGVWRLVHMHCSLPVGGPSDALE